MEQVNISAFVVNKEYLRWIVAAWLKQIVFQPMSTRHVLSPGIAKLGPVDTARRICVREIPSRVGVTVDCVNRRAWYRHLVNRKCAGTMINDVRCECVTDLSATLFCWHSLVKSGLGTIDSDTVYIYERRAWRRSQDLHASQFQRIKLIVYPLQKQTWQLLRTYKDNHHVAIL